MRLKEIAEEIQWVLNRQEQDIALLRRALYYLNLHNELHPEAITGENYENFMGDLTERLED